MSYTPPPFPRITPLVIAALSSPWSELGAVRAGVASAAPTSGTGPTAATAIFVPFVVTTAATFRRGWWQNGSVPAGNICVGIYDTAGTQLATTGNVAAGTASILQQATFIANVTLQPGLYYMAISFSGSTANQVFCVTPASLPVTGKLAGMLTMATANPLPAPATYAAWGAGQVLPQFGIATTSFAI